MEGVSLGGTHMTQKPPWTTLITGSSPHDSPSPSLSPSLSKLEKRSLLPERSSLGRCASSDEEDGFASPELKRRGASVDDFLKGSELGKPVSPGSCWGCQGLGTCPTAPRERGHASLQGSRPPGFE